MNITRRPPQGLERQGRTGGYSYQRDWSTLVVAWSVQNRETCRESLETQFTLDPSHWSCPRGC
eukprot:scaffold27127_cov70-Phaeocystis_antarctica.AAC.2